MDNWDLHLTVLTAMTHYHEKSGKVLTHLLRNEAHGSISKGLRPNFKARLTYHLVGKNLGKSFRTWCARRPTAQPQETNGSTSGSD